VKLPVVRDGETAVAIDDCWNRIGVRGDKTCERLPSVIHCRNCSVFSAAGQRLLRRPPPDGYLEDWTARLAPAEQARSRDTHSVVIFRLGDEWLALETRYLKEITDRRPIHRVPHWRSRVLAGLTNVRGRLEVCVSLREVLGCGRRVDDAPPTRPRVVVVEHEGKTWVFGVDEVHGVHHFGADQVSALPATAARGVSHARGLIRWGERKVGYLDPDRLFPALEAGLS
jgi:chemotaxis-related protein WspD